MATMSLAVQILDVQSIHTIQQGSLCLLSEDYCSTILQKQGAHLQLFHCRVTAVLLKLLVRFMLFKKKYLKQSRHIKQELETIWLTSHRVNFTCCSVVMLSPDWLLVYLSGFTAHFCSRSKPSPLCSSTDLPMSRNSPTSPWRLMAMRMLRTVMPSQKQATTLALGRWALSRSSSRSKLCSPALLQILPGENISDKCKQCLKVVASLDLLF